MQSPFGPSTQQSNFSNFENESETNLSSGGANFQITGSWQNQEDIDLCELWYHYSADSIHGNDQSSETFWNKISVAYKGKHPARPRSVGSLKNRFGKISRQTTFYESQIYKINQANPSGMGGELDLKQRANAEFFKCHTPENKLHPHYYQFMHCYDILNRHPKWNSTLAKSVRGVQSKSKGKGKAQKCGWSSSPGESDGSKDQSFNQLLEEEGFPTTNDEDFVRPPGVKLAKKKKNLKNHWDIELAESKERQLKASEERSAAQTSKLAMMKHFVDIEKAKEEREIANEDRQRRILELEGEKVQLQRQQYEDSVMEKDLTNMDEPTARYWLARKEEILRGKFDP